MFPTLAVLKKLKEPHPAQKIEPERKQDPASSPSDYDHIKSIHDSMFWERPYSFLYEEFLACPTYKHNWRADTAPFANGCQFAMPGCVVIRRKMVKKLLSSFRPNRKVSMENPQFDITFEEPLIAQLVTQVVNDKFDPPIVSISPPRHVSLFGLQNKIQMP